MPSRPDHPMLSSCSSRQRLGDHHVVVDRHDVLSGLLRTSDGEDVGAERHARGGDGAVGRVDANGVVRRPRATPPWSSRRSSRRVRCTPSRVPRRVAPGPPAPCRRGRRARRRTRGSGRAPAPLLDSVPRRCRPSRCDARACSAMPLNCHGATATWSSPVRSKSHSML